MTSLYSGIAKDYVSVISDSGSVIGSYVVSVPAKDGNHHALIFQDYNYSPKLAVSGDNAYAVFTGLDANDVKRAFLRRFYNYGASLDPAVMTSADDPVSSNIESTDVSVAANDSYAFMVYHLHYSDKIVLRRYSESKQALEAAQPLTTQAYYFSGAWYPTVLAGAGQSAYVMWNAATLTYSTDSFNSRVLPVLDYPVDAMTASARIKTALGADGVVHWVARGGFAGGKDQDIIYGRWAPAPAPGPVNKALSLSTSSSDRRYDTMQVPAGDATTNFKSAMTMAVWVQVQAGGATTGTTDVLQPIVHKLENVYEWNGYLLGTHHPAPSRIPTAAITTASGTFWAEHPSGQSVLSEGQWYHLAFTYDSAAAGNNFKLYVNGSVVAQTHATGPLATADGGLFVGKYGNWVLDDLSLWNRALSQSEIAQIRTGPLKGSETGLALYYNFDDTTQPLNNPAASGNLLFQESYVASTVPQISGDPRAVSVDPPAGAGSYASYTFTFSDSLGWQSISVANILINDFIDGRNACFVAVVPSASAVFLVNDAGDAGGPYQGITLPGSGAAQNSQCSIAASGSSIAGSGNTLTVTLAITFKPSFRGNKVMYLAAGESGGANSNWQALGSCSVPGNVTPFGVWVGGVTPTRSSGTGAQTYAFTFNDSSGWQDLGVMNVLINNALNGNQSCYLAYSRQYNVLYLVNDAGTALLAGLVLNGSGSVSNSQCTVTGAGSSASGSGNTLTLTLNMSFPSAFAGNRIVYAAARSNGDALNSGWQAIGSRTVQ
ncbi:MAG: LamG domain-containing protein [Acidobacteriia bacterium]|nr:LamG domain-containing protein [Terriglobia bacterium]